MSSPSTAHRAIGSDTRHPHRFEVAISAVEYDAATADRIAERLEDRFPLGVLRASRRADDADPDAALTAARAFTHDARVVVLLYQRLWGATPSTRADAMVLAHRVATEGTGFLHVVALEDAEPLAWMPEPAAWTDLADAGLDALVERVTDVVIECGGSARRETAREIDARAEREARWDRERDAFLRSVKAVGGSKREFDAVISEIERRLSEVSDVVPDFTFDVWRSPDRCIVQVGRAGLSLSWMQSRSHQVADATLLVIEWDGIITRPGSSTSSGGSRSIGGEGGGRASVLREQSLRLDAATPTSWRWHSDSTGGRSYASPDLAAQCVALLLQRSGDLPI